MEFKCIGTGSKGNSYIVKTDGISFLLDAGCPISEIQKNINLNIVKFAFISHLHRDHSLCMEKLKKRGIPIINGAVYDVWRDWRISDTLKLHTFPVLHDVDINCNGIIIESKMDCILYITDFTLCEFDLSKYQFTHIIIECNYCEDNISQEMINSNFKIRRQIQTHLGLNGLITFLDRLDVSECREIILVHKSTDSKLFSDDKVLTKVFARYLIPVSLCQNDGSIENIGKDDFI